MVVQPAKQKGKLTTAEGLQGTGPPGNDRKQAAALAGAKWAEAVVGGWGVQTVQDTGAAHNS